MLAQPNVSPISEALVGEALTTAKVAVKLISKKDDERARTKETELCTGQ